MIRRYSSWIVLIVALIILAVISTLSVKGPPLPPLDRQNAQSNGGLAAYLWLSRIHRAVTVDQSLNAGRLSTGATLLLLTPQPTLSDQEAGQLLDWMRRGGHLVLASEGDSAYTLLGRLGLGVVPAGGGGVRVVQPLLSAPPVQHLAGSAPMVMAGEPNGAIVASAVDGPVLLYKPVGHGVLWLLTARDLLDNGHIGRADNRRLLLNLVGPDRPVIFEEYAAGISAPGSGWLTTTVWGAALLFAIAALLLYLWSSGRRLGPSLPAPEQQPRVAAEYVTSLAGLLQQAHRRADILRLYRRGLERAITERYGGIEGMGRVRREEAERLLAPVDELSEEELREQAAAIVEFEEILRSERV